MHLRTYSILLLLSFAVIVPTACTTDSEDDSPVMHVNVGDKVPAFRLHGSDGTDVSSSSLDGLVYVLNFFDTRCQDCQQELEILQQVYDKYGAAVPVLNVPRSQTTDEVQTYWSSADLSMPFYSSSDDALYYKFADKIVPRTYVIDRSGRVIAAFSDSPVADYATLDNILGQMVDLNSVKEGMVNLTMRLKVAAGGSGTDEYYFHNEYTVSRLDLYFFDAETKEFSVKLIGTNLTKDDTPANAEYDITYIFEDMRLKAGVYDIFLIANYYYSPEVVANETELLEMVDSITYSNGIEANIPDKGPVMTSRATAKLGIDLIPWIGKHYILNAELERVMAKLQIGVSQNTFHIVHDSRRYADINITNYKMVNLNKRYYLFQHRDSLPDFIDRTSFKFPDNYGEYTDNGDIYVVDPYFYKKTLNTADAMQFRNYYQSWFGDYNTSNFASMPSADNYGYAYILENTCFRSCQKNGYSPGIVFKAAVSPVFVYLYDNALKVLKEENRPEYWPNTIYLYNYNFYGSIQAINVASGMALDELMTYTDGELSTYGIKQIKFNMGVYETYYTYWIHHRQNPLDPMGPMEYGIVRNNFYKIVVTGVNGIGNSAITPVIMRDNYPNSYVDVSITTTP